MKDCLHLFFYPQKTIFRFGIFMPSHHSILTIKISYIEG